MKGDILQSNLKEITTYGDFESHKAEIDAEDLSWILQILSTNLYSDPIGSLVREYSSNAWDANVEAGNKDKPIEVGIQTNADSGSYWYVTDLGPGLSPQRINEVYRKFGKSTKRTSNEAIGMMGLGKFSGLSYTNEVFISTRVDGIQYEYLMHKSDGTPQIDLLTTKLVDLPNGTTIKINIKGWTDRREFEKKTQQQLAFFENVYFNVDGLANLNQNFKMIKGKTFTISTIEDRELRLKIGPVSYPIEWNILSKFPALRTSSFNGVAINFNIGELAITPNRESVLYNKDTTANMEKRLEEFQAELITLYNENTHEYENVDQYIHACNFPSIKIGDKTYGIESFVQHAGIKVKEPKIKDLDLSPKIKQVTEVFYGYTVPYLINKGRKVQRQYATNINIPDPDDKKYIFIDKAGLDPKRTKYVCDTYKRNDWTVIRKSKTVHLYTKDSHGPSYYKLLQLGKYPKAEWRKIIQKFQAWQEKIVKSISVMYDDANPTTEWLLGEKAVKSSGGGLNYHTLRKSNGKILVKTSEHSYKYGKTCVFNNKDWQISNLPNHRKFVIYGTEEHKAILTHLYSFTRICLAKVEIIIVAKTNHKYLEPLTNFIHVNKFMEGKTKYFAEYVSMYRLSKVYNMREYAKLSTTKNLLKALSTEAHNVIAHVEELMKSWRNNIPPFSGRREKFDELLDSMEEVAIKNNYLDEELETLTRQFQKYAADYEFLLSLKTMNPYNFTYDALTIDLAVFVCKKRNIKLNLEWYLPKPEQNEQVEEQTEADS